MTKVMQRLLQKNNSVANRKQLLFSTMISSGYRYLQNNCCTLRFTLDTMILLVFPLQAVYKLTISPAQRTIPLMCCWIQFAGVFKIFFRLFTMQFRLASNLGSFCLLSAKITGKPLLLKRRWGGGEREIEINPELHTWQVFPAHIYLFN